MDSATQILDIAERMMRREGYNAISFRDIAGEMGIKSASLHYHFPKKVNLGEALVARYHKNFHDTLGARTSGLSDPSAKVQIFIDLHRSAIQDSGLICLCAVFGAEAKGLPETIGQGVKAFFNANIAWLSQMYRDANVPNPEQKAKASIAMLEGALIVASVSGDISVFEAAAKFAA